jgi:hypothetical protein
MNLAHCVNGMLSCRFCAQLAERGLFDSKLKGMASSLADSEAKLEGRQAEMDGLKKQLQVRGGVGWLAVRWAGRARTVCFL